MDIMLSDYYKKICSEDPLVFKTSWYVIIKNSSLEQWNSGHIHHVLKYNIDTYNKFITLISFNSESEQKDFEKSLRRGGGLLKKKDYVSGLVPYYEVIEKKKGNIFSVNWLYTECMYIIMNSDKVFDGCRIVFNKSNEKILDSKTTLEEKFEEYYQKRYADRLIKDLLKGTGITLPKKIISRNK